jgi:hypothetical protein
MYNILSIGRASVFVMPCLTWALALLCATNDNQLLMEKQFDVVKIKFHLNDNIE